MAKANKNGERTVIESPQGEKKGDETEKKEKKRVCNSYKEKAENIIGIVLCVLLLPILIANCFLIMQGLIKKDEVPSIFGRLPLIVLTQSMEPTICAGDLIICKKADASVVKEGDVVSFFDPEGNGESVVTHRVTDIEIDAESGKISFRTKGDNNDVEDRLSVPAEKLIGIWTGTRFAGLGNVVLFARSVPGIIVFVVLPLAAIAAWIFLQKRKEEKSKQTEADELQRKVDELTSRIKDMEGTENAEQSDGEKKNKDDEDRSP